MHCYSSGKLAPFQLAGKGLHRPYSAQVPTCTFVDAFLHCSNSLCITFAVVCRTFTIVTMLRPRVSSVESSSVASFIRVLHPLCNLRAHWRVFCMVLLWVITSYRAVVLLVTCTLCASYISTTVRYLWRNITWPLLVDRSMTVARGYTGWLGDQIAISVPHYSNFVPSFTANSHTLQYMVLLSATCYSYVVWVKPILIRTYGVHISLFVLFSVLLRGVFTLLRYMLTWMMGVWNSITVTVCNVSVCLKLWRWFLWGG